MSEYLPDHMDKPIDSVELLEYSTLDLDARDQFDAFSQMFAPVCDLKNPHSKDEGFHVRFSAFDLNGIDIVSYESDRTSSERTNEHIRKTGLDSWGIWFVRNGQFYTENNGQTVQGQTGDLLLLSYAHPWKAHWQGQGFVSLGLDRDRFSWMAPYLDDINRPPLNGPLSGLLRTFISTLVDEVHNISQNQTQLLSRSFSNLLAASVVPTMDNLYNATPVLNASRLAIVRNFIHKHLDRAELNVDLICKSLGMSRRTLYNIFAEHGGVTKYIKSARLEACYQALSDTTDRRLVSTIAYRHGFTNMALFSRQFKEQYGFSPKETRDQNAADRAGLITIRSETLFDHLHRSARSF